MNRKIINTILLLVLFTGVLNNAFANATVHDASKISIEKSAVGSDVIKAWEGLINFPTLRKNIDWLTRSSKWIDEGAEFVTTNGVTKLKKGADEILEIKNEKILPSNYDYNASTGTYNSGGTPIGEASNGYQVYKHGNDLSVRRVPETGGYSQAELDLIDPNNAHVLARHGHDVTDDALRKRAGEGIAPDGSKLGNPNNPIKPFSSKFESPEKLKLAYEKTNPSSAAWASRTQNQYGDWDVIYEDPSIVFGKGIAPPGNGSFETLSKVKASYKQVGSNPDVFEIITMYPIR